MKAFKSVSFKKESRIIWTYASSLVFISVFIMISPVFAQWDKSMEPEVRVDIEKEFDEDGKLIGIDTVKTWSWSGNEITNDEIDSIMDHFSDHFEEFLPRNFDHFSFFDLPKGPPLPNYWEWNEADSTAFSHLDDFFDEGFFENFQEHFNMPQGIHDWDFHGLDSTNFSFQEFDSFENYFDEDFNRNMEDLQERMKGYHEEHQELLDKYFREPSQLEDLNPHEKPRQSIPLPEKDEDEDPADI